METSAKIEDRALLRSESNEERFHDYWVGSDEDCFRDYWVRACESLETRLFSYANRLTNHMSFDAEDLVQDTFYRAFAYPQNPKAIKNPKAYLLRVMRNAWIDRWKKENRANIESLDMLKVRRVVARKYVVVPAVIQLLEREELKREFSHCQGPLTDREKTLLKMHLEGKTSKDIANELNEAVTVIRADVNAVKSKIRYRVKLLTKERQPQPR